MERGDPKGTRRADARFRRFRARAEEARAAAEVRDLTLIAKAAGSGLAGDGLAARSVECQSGTGAARSRSCCPTLRRLRIASTPVFSNSTSCTNSRDSGARLVVCRPRTDAGGGACSASDRSAKANGVSSPRDHYARRRGVIPAPELGSARPHWDERVEREPEGHQPSCEVGRRRGLRYRALGHTAASAVGAFVVGNE